MNPVTFSVSCSFNHIANRRIAFRVNRSQSIYVLYSDQNRPSLQIIPDPLCAILPANRTGAHSDRTTMSAWMLVTPSVPASKAGGLINAPSRENPSIYHRNHIIQLLASHLPHVRKFRVVPSNCARVESYFRHAHAEYNKSIGCEWCVCRWWNQQMTDAAACVAAWTHSRKEVETRKSMLRRHPNGVAEWG